MNIIDATPEQAKWFKTNLVRLEAFATDDRRIRCIYKDGSMSNWFSRDWSPHRWAHVKPTSTE